MEDASRSLLPPKEKKKKEKILYLLSAIMFSLLSLASYYFKIEIVALHDGYILAAIVAFVPPAFYTYRKEKRVKNAEKNFPNLLRDLAQAKRTGLTLIDAVKLTADGEYGELSEGIKTIARQLTWSVPFEDALRTFANRYPHSTKINRSTELIIEGYRSGGEVGNVLKIAADDVTETIELERKRSAEISSYVAICYITFLVFLLVLLVLYKECISTMIEAAEKIAETGTGRGGSLIHRVDAEKLKMILFHCAIVEGVCSGFVAGKLSKGKLIAGLEHIVILSFLAFAAFAALTYFEF